MIAGKITAKKILAVTLALVFAMSNGLLAAGGSLAQYAAFSQSYEGKTQPSNDFIKLNPKNDTKVESLLAQMTIEEKLGQLTQFCDWVELTGPAGEKVNIDKLAAEGKVGSVLNYTGVEKIRKLQKIAVEQSRLHIPLLFGLDVIHGYRTIFPVPLGQSASFNLSLIEQAERVAAREAAAAGVNWTFAPMVDVSRDPRWGRMAEGPGEDPYLAACIADARVRGFQGKELAKDNSAILACAKHYVGYGAPEGGKDYYSTTLMPRQLYEIYLPPFASAVQAGCGSVMPAFSDIDGIPMTANAELIKGTLFGKLGFHGVTVSDWTAISELVNHGVAADNYQAAKEAIAAGVDIDMVSGAYLANLKTALQKNEVAAADIDDAVRRVLRAKYALGLFDNPYKYCDEQREQRMLKDTSALPLERALARESIVLLKNQDNILPLAASAKKIAVVGPFADSAGDMKGCWSAQGEDSQMVSILAGIKSATKAEVLYAQGVKPQGVSEKNADNSAENAKLLREAAAVAAQADVVVLTVGETAWETGESTSRTDLNLPVAQKQLVKTICATGKPVVLLLVNGRPLLVGDETAQATAVLETWYLGNQAGNAIADVLFGKYNPSGKLPVTFPRSMGQIPLHYGVRNSGRPHDDNNWFSMKYLDSDLSPLYSFGYGLSYTTFSYSDIKTDQAKIRMTDSVNCSVRVTNNGKYTGQETVQLYIRDMVASVTQPLKVLRGFQKIELKPGESKVLTFKLTANELAFYNRDMVRIVEPGQFQVYIGGSSRDQDCLKTSFEVIQ